MLILIGTVPTAYALNHAVTYHQSQDFVAVSEQAAQVLDRYVQPGAVIGDARDDVTEFIRTKQFNANTMLAMRTLVNDIGTETSFYFGSSTHTEFSISDGGRNNLTAFPA